MGGLKKAAALSFTPLIEILINAHMVLENN